MRFSSILAPLSLLSLAVARPSAVERRGGPGSGGPGGPGIPYNTAVKLVDAFVSTLTAFDESVARNLLAPNFQDFSDSINFLIGAPAGSVTFPSPDAYIAGQGAQPPIGIEIKGIDVTKSGVIAFRWTAAVGRQTIPANGISVLYTVKSGPDASVVGPGGYQLETLFTEFNSAAWVIDIGGSVTVPPLGPPAKA